MVTREFSFEITAGDYGAGVRRSCKRLGSHRKGATGILHRFARNIVLPASNELATLKTDNTQENHNATTSKQLRMKALKVG